jgi:hypothetical protein
MRKRLVLVFFGLFITILAWCQYSDSILVAEKSNYLTSLLSKKGSVQYIMGVPNKMVHPRDKFHTEKPLLLLKTDTILYLSFFGSGRIYKLYREDDSSYIFSRLDRTENINYNLGANYFSYKGQVFSFGGYGFWKSNGNLKLFNQTDQQWDIVPLSEEIIPQYYPLEASWFNNATGKFFVPLQSIVNAGIAGTEYVKGKVIPYSYELNINTKQWKRLGKTNHELIEIITNGQQSFRSEKGLIILYYDKAYLIDFNANRVYSSNSSFFNQGLARKGTGDFVYEKDGFIYSYNHVLKESDSLTIDYNYFIDTGLTIWEPLYNFTTPVSIILLIISLILIVYFARVKKKKIVDKPVQEKNYRIQFTDTEIALLNLLILKVNDNQRANINEVNYVLGLKHKNTGLQKKVRSDTFSNINEKFRYITKIDDPLIQSIRSEIDKRYFEYFINSNHISLIQEYLN